MILADTGFWLALANRRDRHHDRATAVAAKLRGPLVVTWPVLTETCHLMSRLGADAEIRFVNAASRGAVELFELHAAHFSRIVELLDKYRDLPMDLANCHPIRSAGWRRTFERAESFPPMSATSGPTDGRTTSRSGTCCSTRTPGFDAYLILGGECVELTTDDCSDRGA